MAEIAQTFSIDPYAAERSKIARQQKFAELLQSQALQPNEKFSYAGIEAPISAAGGLAKALQAGMSGYLQGDAARKEDELVGKYEKRDAERQSAANEFLVDLQRGQITPEQDFGSTDTPGSFPLMPGAMEQDGRSVMPQQQTPYSAQERQAKAVQALGSNNPYLAQVAPMVYASAEGQMTRDADREFRAGESAENRLARKIDNQAVLDARAADNKLALDARIADANQRSADRRSELEQRLNDARISREEAAALKRELAENAATLQRQIEGMRQDGSRSKLSPAAEKELFETEDVIQSGTNVMGAIDQALTFNDKAYDGALALTRAQAWSNTPVLGGSEEADATINMDNIITGQALESLKSTFGATPTEGERKILIEMQASVNKTKDQRKDILDRARTAAGRRVEFNKRKAEAIRTGDYKNMSYSDGAPAAPPAGNPPPVSAPAAPPVKGWSIRPVSGT